MCSLKKYLVVRASGGISNRLQAVLGGIIYCLLTKRVLCVDWRDGLYSDDFSNVFNNWFQIQGLETASYEEVNELLNKGASIYPPFWQEHFTEPIAIEYFFEDVHMSPKNVELSSYPIISLADNAIQNDASILVYWDWKTERFACLLPLLRDKMPELSSMDNLSLFSYLCKKYIKPSNIVQKAMQDFYDEHFPTSPPIGIHIRHSDLQSPLPKMLAMLEEVTEKEKNKDTNIFLCTDNEMVERMVRKLFPQTVTYSKIFQAPNVPLHCYVPGISNVQKGFEAVVEMLLLAHCRHIIHYKRSSFAYISILYSDISIDCIHQVN